MTVNTLTIELTCNGKTLKMGPGQDIDITAVSGLEASEVEISTSDNALVDGASVDGKKIKPRPIHIEASFRSSKNNPENRAKVIKFFNPKYTGKALITNMGVSRNIEYELEGWTFAASKNMDSKLKILVDLICPDPYIPDKSFYNGVMNDTNVTTGSYYGSKMKTSGLANALATVKADFGADHILTHRILLANAVSNGASSGWAWYDSQIDLMNEHMVYGSYAWGGGAQNGYDVGADKSQLALFQARPDLITNRENWWLRDVRSATNFCYVNANGSANFWTASNSLGVRPAFLIY